MENTVNTLLGFIASTDTGSASSTLSAGAQIFTPQAGSSGVLGGPIPTL